MIGTTTRTRERQNRPLEEVIAEKRTRAVNLPVQFQLKGVFLYALIAVVVLGMLGLANGYQEGLVCDDISIQVTADKDNAFMAAADVKEVIQETYGEAIIGEKMNSIELLRMEELLKENAFIQQAEVYKSLKGILYVDVEIRKPIARIVNENGSSMYLDEFGNKFPTTHRYVANVPLVRGAFMETFVPADSLSCALEEAIPVLKYIHQSDFWKAQISEVRIREDGELLFYPEVGKMYMEFGKPNNMNEKFDNLKLFFEQVANEIGWNTYQGISVKYRGQVVAKKR